MRENHVSSERAKALLDYSPETGELRWKVDRKGKAKAGTLITCKNAGGYVVLAIDGKQYGAHRIAWLIATGEAPYPCIDHINGDRADNRLQNLRVVSHAGNVQNQRTANRLSGSGLLGVSWKKDRNKWRAAIDADGRKLHLGYFADKYAAQNAYLAAKRQLHSTATI